MRRLLCGAFANAAAARPGDAGGDAAPSDAEDDSGDPGRARKAQEALWEAAVAAADAFPLGSPRSDALHVVLGAVSGLLRGTEVTA